MVTLLSALVLLTHLHALLLIAALSVLLFSLALTSNRVQAQQGASESRLIRVLKAPHSAIVIAMLGGIIVAGATFPGYLALVQRGSAQFRRGATMAVGEKLLEVLGHLLSISSQASLLPRITTFTLLLVAVWLTLKSQAPHIRRHALSLSIRPFLLVSLILGSQVFLYLSGASPDHAMQPRYIASWAPLFLVGLSFLLSPVMARFTALLLLLGVVQVGAQTHSQSQSPAILALKKAEHLVVNSTHRGLLGPIILELSPSAQVLAANPHTLLRTNLVPESRAQHQNTTLHLLAYPRPNDDPSLSHKLNEQLAQLGKPKFIGWLPMDGRLFRLRLSLPAIQPSPALPSTAGAKEAGQPAPAMGSDKHGSHPEP